MGVDDGEHPPALPRTQQGPPGPEDEGSLLRLRVEQAVGGLGQRYLGRGSVG